MKITLNRDEIENALLNVVREKMVATSETIEEDGTILKSTIKEAKKSSHQRLTSSFILYNTK
jgi:nitrogen-specific signal transduction histidine kinase